MASTLMGLCQGQRGVVESVDGAGDSRRRLLDLGLTPGAAVECLFSAPSGDPRAYMVRGSVIALRREDAGRVRLGTGEA